MAIQCHQASKNDMHARPTIVFLHGLQQALAALVATALPKDCELHLLPATASQQEQADALRDADFLVVYRASPHAAAVAGTRRLKLVQLLSAGFDGMDLRLFADRNIPVANNGGANSHAVADQAVLMMLALYRRALSVDRQVRAGAWNHDVDGLNTFEMAHKVVGILGLGNIGRKVARRVQGFDARVQYYNPSPLSPRQEQELDVKRVSFDELVQTSDVLSLHLPLTPATHHLIDADQLRSMRRSAILINTSRGAIVDEAALAQALVDGTIAGAGLDAFAQEPVAPDSPLLQLDNVVLSPHSGGTTADTWCRRGQFAAQNIVRVLGGCAAESLVKA
jgi:lactate dehydrogenase-like 2-hydroxyacid dehydrogenase